MRNKMAQFAARPDPLSSIPRIHLVEGENFWKLSSTQFCTSTYIQHTINEIKYLKKINV